MDCFNLSQKFSWVIGKSEKRGVKILVTYKYGLKINMLWILVTRNTSCV